ncbi:hypothetical protein [Streptomyces sp. L2]|uniref:hypothetical protein n=1 Tax=Streptomyces sp. L2 TaxID=2162665 RepID=UPI001F51223A|nr:hypothetical protein [Streptomyces sp. L2]
MPERPVPDRPVEESPATPATPVRRRGRTTLIVAGAAALGLVAGTCAGYLVQAGRTPTKLPSLSQPVVHQAKGYVQPLTAAQDHRVKTDGDLRKLLLTRPGGTQKTDRTNSWSDLGDYVEDFDEPGTIFGQQLGDEFRRVAVTGWRKGSTVVDIQLVQYRQDTRLAAADSVDSQRYYGDHEPNTRSWSLPGTGDGMVYVFDTPKTKSGYLPLYTAEAIASRGDIYMDIWIASTKRVPKDQIMNLAKKQVGRL